MPPIDTDIFELKVTPLQEGGFQFEYRTRPIRLDSAGKPTRVLDWTPWQIVPSEG